MENQNRDVLNEEIIRIDYNVKEKYNHLLKETCRLLNQIRI